jgi:hypothetical protein
MLSNQASRRSERRERTRVRKGVQTGSEPGVELLVVQQLAPVVRAHHLGVRHGKQGSNSSVEGNRGALTD